MPDINPAPENGDDEARRLRERVVELEQKLEQAEARESESRQAVYDLIGYLFPYQSPTADEIREMMDSPRGQSLLEIIEEYEQNIRG